MKLNIKQSHWSAWTPIGDHDKRSRITKEAEKNYDVNLNEKYVVKTSDGREVLSFEIIEINNSNIKIHTFQSLLGFDEIILNDKTITGNRGVKQDFQINIERPLYLNTPTRDSGHHFVLTLIK